MKPKTKFEKMTRAQKRVSIAKDVLKQIAAKKYLPRKGVFLRVQNEQAINQATIKDGVCKVCALGAALASVVRIDNKFNSWVSVSQAECVDRLAGIFDPKQLKLMEGCFEGYSYAPVEFYENNGDDEQRARAIFSNIITNKGTFKL